MSLRFSSSGKVCFAAASARNAVQRKMGVPGRRTDLFRFFAKKLAVAALISSCCAAAAEQKNADPAEYWDFRLLSAPPPSRAAGFADSETEGLDAVLFEGIPVNGRKTEVFAYLGFPASPPPPGGYPGVVLVHGGGGTAYPEYAKLWIRHGYAVIMPDWYGKRPLARPRRENGKTIHSVPLSEHGRPSIRDTVGHLVLAHSLLRSQKKVNPEKTALIGLSWGSWYGAIVTAVDPRFKGIVEIYCGDRRPESDSMINGCFLHAAKVPMYWVCSTNDQNVTPVTLQNAFDACPKTVNQSLVINLPHSHVGFTFPACFRMAGHFLKGETALPVIGKAVVKDGIASAPLLGRGRGIIRTVFCYTTDRNQVKTHLRVWKSIPAELHGNTLSVTLPEGIFQGFFSAYDQESSFHDCCGSGNLLQF